MRNGKRAICSMHSVARCLWLSLPAESTRRQIRLPLLVNESWPMTNRPSRVTLRYLALVDVSRPSPSWSKRFLKALGTDKTQQDSRVRLAASESIQSVMKGGTESTKRNAILSQPQGLPTIRDVTRQIRHQTA